jgi:acetaldehyde dehydrogenase (acetylating)
MADVQQNEEQGKEAKKVLANFEQTVNKLTAIVRGPENLKLPTRVKKDNVQVLVEELFKEESEATIKEVKEGVKALLKGYVALNSSLAEERKKLDLLEVAKKKEFNATAARLFSKIDGIDNINREYQAALGAAQAAVENKEEDPE